MKRFPTLLLTVLLSAGLLSGCVPVLTAPLGPGRQAFSDSIEAQAFAVVMACHERGGPADAAEADFLWEATGWYAAWLYRTQGLELLEEALVHDFQRSLGGREESGPPDGIRQLHASGGLLFYEFPRHRARMDELLGQTLEFLLDAPAEPEARITLREHYSLHGSVDRNYELRFARNREAGSAFSYRLLDAAVPAPGPAMDPGLDFDWAGLTAANSLTNLLSLFPCVEVCDSFFGQSSTWFFRRDGDLCVLIGGGDWYYGEYRGCRFEYGKAEDGAMRGRITGFDNKAGSLGAWDAYVTGIISDAVAVELVRTDGETVLTRLTFPDGRQLEASLDRGVLALRELIQEAPDGGEPPVISFRYDAAPSLGGILDGWDAPLRRVTLIWESFSGGRAQRRSDTLLIPADWEVFPEEALRGDYTVYMNEGYTMPYAYPGDGIDYTLYLTTAKG